MFKLFSGKDFENPLSSSDQKKYLELAQQGDKKAKEIFIKHNLRLVATVLNKYYKNYDEETKNELFSEGCVGLIKALKYFKPSYNNEFSTYAIPMISGEIRRFIRDNNIVHIPRSIINLSRNILKLQDENYIKNNIGNLSTVQIAKILKVDENEVKLALNSLQPISSLHSPIFLSEKSDDEILLEETLKDDNIVIYKNLEKKEIYEDLVKNLDSLPEKEKKVIKLLFGIDCKIKNQSEVAELLGISQSQVSRIKTAIIKKLKTFLPEYIKDEYDKNLEPKQINKIKK